MKRYLSAFSAFIFPFVVFSQITVTPNPSPQEVTDFLEGADITLTDLSINCYYNAYGFFDGTNSNIGIASGMSMSTGILANMIGPNDTGTDEGYDNSRPGDIDLDILNTVGTRDACIIEFNCTPQHDAILFDYVFGSEEYLEWVNAGFNDVFAIYFSGPGISGLQNFALVPGTSDPITINTINDSANSSYYVSNDSGATVQYDGFTTVITSFVPVIVSESYHVKIAIADGGDGIVDSGVMFNIFSFRSMNINAIEEQSLRNHSVFPNPLKDNLTVSYQLLEPEIVTVSITDINGRIIVNEIQERSTGMHQSTINFGAGNLQAGVYLLNIKTESQNISEKLVVTP